MANRRKKRTTDEVDQMRDFALRVLGDTPEGLVLGELMQSPLGELVAHLQNATGLSRTKVKRAAEELVRRELVINASDITAANGGKLPGYKFAPIKFPELQ